MGSTTRRCQSPRGITLSAAHLWVGPASKVAVDFGKCPRRSTTASVLVRLECTARTGCQQLVGDPARGLTCWVTEQCSNSVHRKILRVISVVTCGVRIERLAHHLGIVYSTSRSPEGRERSL